MRFPTLLSLFFLSACSYDPYYYYYSCTSYVYGEGEKALALVLHNDELLTENKYGDISTYEKNYESKVSGDKTFRTMTGGKDGQIVQLVIKAKELDMNMTIFERTYSKKYREDSKVLLGDVLSDDTYQCLQIARTLTATHK